MVQKTAPSAADMITQALAHHRAGRLAPAERFYREALKLQPRNTQALSGLGLIAAQTGHLQPARDLLGKALQTAPKDPDCLVNLAKVDVSLGDVASAEGLLRKAVTLRKRDAIAWNLLGWCQQKSGRLEDAEASFRHAVKADPTFAEGLNNLGTALMLRGERAEAVEILRRCIALAPNAAQPHMNLGILLGALGRFEAALDHARRAVDLAPDSADARFNLGKLLHERDELEAAEAEYRTALRIAPGNPHFMNNLALLLDALLRPAEALEWAEKAAAAIPSPIGEIHENVIRALIGQGRFADALSRIDGFLAQAPERQGMRLLRADILVREGRFDAARDVYRGILDADPGSMRALRGLARTGRIAPGDPLVARMQEAARRDSAAVDDRVDLYFALGKAHDDVGDHEAAFGFYAQGNALKNTLCRYDPAEHEDYVSAIIETFTPAFFAERGDWGSDSTRPVMILGMPRSGTTLVEQILSSHPDVTGGDELPDFNLIERMFRRRHGYPAALPDLPREALRQYVDLYLGHLDRIDSAARRVTDKLPGNALRLGLIALLFPKAQVVHCRRDPVDTCLSIYFQNFAGQHDYAYDLTRLGHFYRQYERLMAHWHAVAPMPILDVVYEEVVADHEAQGKRMIEHLGLDWHPDMAAFHANRRTVSTASVWQVRQPIYKGSVQRWRKYERHIGPLLEALGVDA